MKKIRIRKPTGKKNILKKEGGQDRPHKRTIEGESMKQTVGGGLQQHSADCQSAW